MLSAYSACLWCELSLERAPENWKCRTFRCLVTCMLSMWLLQYTKFAWNLSQNDILQSLTYPNTHFTGRIFMKFYTEHHNMDAVLYVRFHNDLLTEKVSVNMRNLTRFEWKTYFGRIFFHCNTHDVCLAFRPACIGLTLEVERACLGGTPICLLWKMRINLIRKKCIKMFYHHFLLFTGS